MKQITLDDKNMQIEDISGIFSKNFKWFKKNILMEDRNQHAYY
jgi:hypothetical protein